MKTRIFILPLLLCAVASDGARASEYEWDDAVVTSEPGANVTPVGQEIYNDGMTSVYMDYPTYPDDTNVQFFEQPYSEQYDTIEVPEQPVSNYKIATGGEYGGTTVSHVANRNGTSVSYITSNLTPMHNVKLLSIKPAPADSRPPVWDGTDGNYKSTAHVKTVDWRNGVPIWDDSISDYRAKDFRDWMLKRLPELYIRDSEDTELVNLYNQTMEDVAATNARIEELLGNKDKSDVRTCDRDPDITLTTTFPAVCDERYAAQDLTIPVQNAFGAGVISIDDGCPFDTETECNIWRRKPIIRETVSPRSPKIRDINMAEILFAFNQTGELDANSVAAAPLLDRYKMLMRSASACCTEGMKYSLKQAGASKGLIYKFLADDANFYNIGGRCLMMSDQELDEKYPGTATATTVADVRNGCLCRGRQWFSAMLAPFVDLWRASPEFERSRFYWTYIDGLQREVTVAINDDVKNVLEQLSTCP